MKIGFIFNSFSGGGAEKVMVDMANAFSKISSIDVSIYVIISRGPYFKNVDDNIKVIDFEAKFGAKSVIYKIRDSLKNDCLDSIISTQEHINSIVCLASIGLNDKPQIILREANTPSLSGHGLFRRFIYSHSYQLADNYVAVSNGVKDDMIKYYGLKSNDISTIYNPVIDESVLNLKNESIDDSWFYERSEYPIILGIGRIAPQKGFEDLIELLFRVRKKIPARLMILGNYKPETEYFKFLRDKVKHLNIEEHVRFIGFVNNPYKYMKRADLFVLSSNFEGLPSVLIQAMACGCPVISYDCPSGPREILKNGKYGKLIDAGDINGLTDAVLNNLLKKDEYNTDDAIERALQFNMDSTLKEYCKLLSINI